MQNETFALGEGMYALEASVTKTSNGLSVTLCSVEHGHIGAVAAAVPANDTAELLSCTTLPTHRDDAPAKELALKLAEHYGTPAVVSVGMHIDNATKEDIQKLVANATALGDKIIACL